MPLTKRSRKFSGKYGAFKESKDSGTTWKETANQIVDMGAQVTESEGHPLLRNGVRDGGGPFYTSLVKRSFPTRNIKLSGFANRLDADIGTPLFLSHIPPSYRLTPSEFRSNNLSDLDPYGATAIARSAPINPNAELATGFGEALKDGLPSLPGIQTWKRRTNAYLGVASEFLNTTFGWLPLVSEVDKVSSSIAHRHSILSQFRRDSGRNIHREFAFPVETKESVSKIEAAPTVIPTGTTGFGSSFQGRLSATTLTQTIKVESRKWFSGSFTYCLPESGDSFSKVERAGSEAQHLLGISLTPDVLWELTPWSWAIDWFSNTGDVIHNFTLFDQQGLVMRYGYIMEERSVTITHVFTPPADEAFSVHRGLPPSSYQLRSKVRRPANPFGFGISEAALSPLQIAIAAAVGITHL